MGLRLNSIDKALIWWVISSIVTYTIMFGSVAALVYRLGVAYDVGGLYFLFRFLLRTRRDIVQAIQELAICVIPLSMAMLTEKLTGRNSFAIFGGDDAMTRIRDGVLRCQGPFSHPILAGTFGAVTAPLFVSLWYEGGSNRLLAILAVAAAGIIPLTAGSSGPILAYVAGFFGLAMWILRKKMRIVRWSVVSALVILQLFMNHPIWWGLEHISVFSGNTGWYRALLIEEAWRHLGDWWLVGVKSTAYWGRLLTDVTNQYIRTGVDGGLITLLLFLLVIKRCYAGIGRAIKALNNKSRIDQKLLWALGSALFVHLIAFIDVAYWDQTIVAWYGLLAFISASTGMFLPAQRTEPVPPSSDRIIERQMQSLQPHRNCIPVMDNSSGIALALTLPEVTQGQVLS
jgi:hypothetical protein